MVGFAHLTLSCKEPILRFKMGWLDNKNSLKHYENRLLKQLNTANTNSPWAYIRDGLLSEGFLRLRFRGAYFREGLFLERLIIGILRYKTSNFRALIG